MHAREYRGARWIASFGWGLAGLSVAALIAISIAGRARRVETPHWDAPRFAAVSPNGGDAPDASRAAGRELWLVAVNPGCPHCRASLARVIERARPLGANVNLAALLVDAPTRPDSSLIAGLDAPSIYWDSAGVWKHHWGRHEYGETMIFDSTGALVRIDPIAP